MIRGLYTSALGMTVQMRKMDITADNLANVSTTGFKKDTPVSRSFSEVYLWRLDDPAFPRGANIGGSSQGVFIDDVYTDYERGTFIQTGSPLDLAIEGGGFFAVAPADRNAFISERYTRDGKFTLSADGTLVTTTGDTVLGTGGAIRLPPGKVSVLPDGRIFAGGAYVDTLKMVDFADTHVLRKAANNAFEADASVETVAFSGVVQAGFLEDSNVNPIREMVKMISVSRVFEANQKMITMHDTTLGRAVSDIARK